MRKTNAISMAGGTTLSGRAATVRPTVRAMIRPAIGGAWVGGTILLIAAVLAVTPALGRAAKPSAVTYYRSETVTNSFDKGAVLFQGEERYMIHTSRRTAPGMAEVHAADTDLIYVLQGEATFVTGGRVVGGKETAPGETRGATIQGGETRTLSPGDVIIVPNNVPHWFKDVRGPFLYYTVKVR